MRQAKILIAILIAAFELPLVAGTLTEKSGRYEINWSTGLVRFYGTSLLNPSAEEAWRPAEQRAWADGIGYLQKTGKAVFGKSPKTYELKSIDRSLSLLSSLNTTYYGDSRIKVTLETQIDQVYRQMAQDLSGNRADPQGAQFAVIKLSKKMSPTVAFAVVDENKANLLEMKDVAYNVAQGAQANRWYKSDLPKDLSEPAQTVKAVPLSEDTIQISAADWSPQLKDSLATGKVALIVP